jgi:hypothetical protein
MSFLWGMTGAIIVFVFQGPVGDYVLDGLKWFFDLFVGEVIFTLDGLKELLCQASSRCRNNW